MFQSVISVLVVTFIATAVVLVENWLPNWLPGRRQVALILVIATLLVAGGGALFVIIGVLLWPVALVALWQDISAAAQGGWIRLGFTAVCLLIGILLYLARATMPQVYGAAEVLVGTAICWVALGNYSSNGSLQTSLSGALALAVGLYVIVRGIDNARRPQEKPPEQVNSNTNSVQRVNSGTHDQ